MALRSRVNSTSLLGGNPRRLRISTETVTWASSSAIADDVVGVSQVGDVDAGADDVGQAGAGFAKGCSMVASVCLSWA